MAGIGASQQRVECPVLAKKRSLSVVRRTDSGASRNGQAISRGRILIGRDANQSDHSEIVVSPKLSQERRNIYSSIGLVNDRYINSDVRTRAPHDLHSQQQFHKEQWVSSPVVDT